MNFCQKWSKEKKRKENGWVKWVKKEIQLYDTVTVSDIGNILLKSPCGEGNGHPLQYCLENPGTVKPGGLPSLGSHRVGHDWSDLAAAAAELQNEKSSGSGKHCVWRSRSVEVRDLPSVTPRKAAKMVTEGWEFWENVGFEIDDESFRAATSGAWYIGKGLCSRWFCRQHLRNLQYLELYRKVLVYWLIRKSSGFEWKVVFIHWFIQSIFIGLLLHIMPFYKFWGYSSEQNNAFALTEPKF